jgi:hypothetical protein
MYSLASQSSCDVDVQISRILLLIEQKAWLGSQ